MKLVEREGKQVIEIDPYDIIHDILNGEQRQMLIESLSCHDDVINHVAEMLVDGYTYNGFSGSWCSSRTSAEQQARQKIAENSGYSVKKTLEDMERQIKSLQESIEWYQNNWTPSRNY